MKPYQIANITAKSIGGLLIAIGAWLFSPGIAIIILGIVVFAVGSAVCAALRWLPPRENVAKAEAPTANAYLDSCAFAEGGGCEIGFGPLHCGDCGHYETVDPAAPAEAPE